MQKVCSWISPSTTLQPLTVVILNVLNSLVPIYTDSLVLYLLVKEKASHSDSKIELASSMGTPILLKFMRLVNAVTYIHTSAEFILTSFVIAEGGVNTDTTIMMGRMRNVYMTTNLQLVDNLSVSSHHVRHLFVDIIARRYSLYVHWSHTIKIWKLIGSARPSALPFLHARVMLICWSFLFIIIIPAPLNLTSIVGLVCSFSLNYILPIVLNAAQLAISSYIRSSNIAMLIDSAKVVINIVSLSARVTMLSTTKHLIDLPASSALLGKVEDVARDILKVVPVPPPVAFPDDAIEATVLYPYPPAIAASGPAPATGSQMEQYSGDVNATVER
jgi:hypothetical protein